MTDAHHFDVLVIGAGPGGYIGAIRAAQLDLHVACVEQGPTLGGTCLNIGCIPSKALLDSSEWFAQAQNAFARHGVVCDGLRLDLPVMMSRKESVVQGLAQGIAGLFKKHGVTHLQGHACVRDPHSVEITAEGGVTQTVHAQSIVIATGSEPISLPTLPFDGDRIISSTEALSLSAVPHHLVVIGGGAIGLELGSVWLRLGAQVTVIELTPHLIPGTDVQISSALQRALKRQGFTFFLQTCVTQADVQDGLVSLTLENETGQQSLLEADRVLVAVGRKPYTMGLGVTELGIALDERGRIAVDHHYRTSVPSVYAIGDAIAGPMLAHKAEEEGVALAEQLAGHAGHVNYEALPSIVYTWPEVATVGLSEEAAKAAGVAYRVGTFPFVANGRARCLDAAEGMVKVLADAKSDRLLGLHLVGPRASDLIAEAVVAMEFGAAAEDLARSVHAHPTLSEALREAALSVESRSRQR